MSEVAIPQFDSLAQGTGYAQVPTPTSDSSELHGLSSSEGTKDSTNDPPTVNVMSVESKTSLAPETGAFLRTNLHDDENWLDPMSPYVGTPER